MTRHLSSAGLVCCLVLGLACSDTDRSGRSSGGDDGGGDPGGGGPGGAAAGGSGQGGVAQAGDGPGGDAPGGSGTGGSGTGGSGTGGTGVASSCAPGPATDMVALVNEYRAANGLQAIPCSPSLSFVADTHVHDLQDNAPHQQANCNLHSWSDQGSWTPCCYTPDHAEAECMWNKPGELTSYSGNGYENAAGSGGSITPEQAVNMWKQSSGHNAVMLNEGMWGNLTWRALGGGIHQGYAVLWFGEQVDPAR